MCRAGLTFFAIASAESYNGDAAPDHTIETIMKIFISSLITGFETFRAAAKAAILTLGHEPVMVEDFGAVASTPQIACLKGLRSADLVVLILGGRYGYVQGTSGVSPTHEEYLDAKGKKPILMFVQQGVERDELQAALIKDAQAWQVGGLRDPFKDANDLKDQITRALHRHLLSNASAPLDLASLKAQALKLLPRANRQSHVGSPLLQVAISAGPSATILRPAEIEAPALAKAIQQQAMFGNYCVFDSTNGSKPSFDGSALVLKQEGGAHIQLDEDGSLLLCVPIHGPSRSEGRGFGLSVLLEEHVCDALKLAFGFANWILEHVDATQRITHVGIAIRVDAGDYFGWRTIAEHETSPNSMSIGMGTQGRPPVEIDKPRVALAYEAKQMAEDLTVRLRRQWKSTY